MYILRALVFLFLAQAVLARLLISRSGRPRPATHSNSSRFESPARFGFRLSMYLPAGNDKDRV